MTGYSNAEEYGLLREELDRAGTPIGPNDLLIAATARVGDIAFTSKGTIGRFARVTEHTGRFVYSPQVCYWRSLDASTLHPVMLYCWMQSDDLRAQIAAVAGQTDRVPYVSLTDRSVCATWFGYSTKCMRHYVAQTLLSVQPRRRAAAFLNHFRRMWR